uniref:NAC domain-containing protein n=1 Tax=Oryza nivara TaxID=4536 RepID=A0A0E0J2V6_ORYNI
MENGGNDGDGSAMPVVSWKHELVSRLQLSPSFHFVPTDKELVDFHLREIQGLWGRYVVLFHGEGAIEDEEEG